MGKYPRILFRTCIWLLSFCLPISASGADKVTLQLIWKNQFQFSGYYIARELGFYEDAGLDVTIKEYEFGTDVTADVVSQTAHFGVGRSSLILERMEGQPVFLLSAIFQHSPFMLLAKERGDLKEVADLKGKRIMVTDDVVGMASLTAMLTANGIRPDDYTPLKHTFSVDDLISGNTDAIAAYTSNEPYHMQKRGIDYTIFAPKDHGFDFYSDILFTSQKLYQNNPQLMEKFHRASLRGWEYAFAHIDEAVDIILKKYNTQNRGQDALRFEANTLKELAYDGDTPLGRIAKGRVEKIAQVYQLLGFTNKPLKTAGLIYTPTDNVRIQLTAEERAWLDEHPVIRVRVGKWPPFHFIDGGKPKGLAIDYVTTILTELGLKIEFVPLLWDEALQSISNLEKIDLLPTIAWSKDREELVNITSKYLSFPYVIFTRKDQLSIESLNELAGKTVVVENDYITHTRLEADHPAIELLLVKTTQAALEALSFGEADAYVGNLAVGSYLSENLGLQNLKVAARTNYATDNQSIGIRKDWPELAGMVENALKSFTAEEHRRIRNRWLALEEASGDRGTVDLTSKEQEWLRANPVIRVHNEKDWPPFNFFEYDSPRGLSIDYMDLVAEKLGIDVEYVTGPSWNEFLGMVKRKELDVMLNIVKTEDRMKYLLYTEPYIKNPNVIVSSQENPYETIESLFGKTVAFPKGFFYEEVLTKSFPQIKRLPVENTLASLKAVTFGRADAALGEAAVVRTLINKNFLSGLRISGEVDIGHPDLANLRLGVRDDWPLLQSALMKAMAAITPQEMNRIRQKWLVVGESAPSLETTVPISYGRLMAYGIAVFLILSMLAWLLIKTIKKEQIAVHFGSRWFRGLFLAGLSVFVIIICLLSWFTIEQIRGKILVGISEDLRETLIAADDRLNLWMEQRTSSLKLLVRDSDLVTLTLRLLAVPPKRDDLLASRALQDVRSFFKNNKVAFLDSGFFIINPNFVSIASIRDTNIGTRNIISFQRPTLLRRVFAGEFLFVPPIESDVPPVQEPKADRVRNPSTKFFMGPIRDPKGQIIAVMTLRVNLSKDLPQLLTTSKKRKTGETYAFSEHGELLSQSRFDELLRRIGLIGEDQQSALNVAIRDPGVNLEEGKRPEIERSQQPLTRMASRALQLKRNMEKRGQTYGRSKIEIDTQGYRDYRGVPVFGAWLWNANLELGLTTEIDMAEAMSDYYQIRRTVFGMLAVTVLLSVGATMLVLLIGERTSQTLRKSRDELELRVQERTAELRKLSQATENSPASVVVTDKNGAIEYVNPTFCEVSGYSADEAIGQNPSLLKSGNLPESYYKELWDTILSGKIWRGEFINKTKNGEEFWESASISPILDDEGEITHFVAVKQDTTERKHMEQELLAAKEKAEEATRAKSDFLANMSHEIRTPMNAVIGMSHLALKTELTPKQQDYLNKIQSSANSLLGIINDILDFSKIEAGKLDMESTEFNLDDVLDNLANLVTVKAQEKEDLEVLFATGQQVPRFLVGDPLRLGQVLINLANNAVKFTESGEIVVSTDLIEQDEAGLTIKFSVRDTGIGLTKDQIGKLFQSFSQADTSTTRKFGGTGLGLTISKRLVEMMGGEIWVESEPGQGTTFSFTANFGLGKEKVKTRLVPSSDLRGMKVLVVDDSATSRNILQDILESFSFEVTLAASGEEGLAEIQKADTNQPYELVLMDWKMPGLDGLKASERIKNQQTLSQIPAIILVTAYGREEIMQQAEQIGLDGFLIKPIGSSVLFDTILHVFGEEITKRSRISEKNEESEESKNIQGAQILLVEDNEINQQVALEILQGAGLNVTVANDGQEAVNAVKESHYDTVLMDIQMPVMDGYEATRRIRKWEGERRNAEVGLRPVRAIGAYVPEGMRNVEKERKAEDSGQMTDDSTPTSNLQPPAPNIPIIAMTAHAMAGDDKKSIEAGMNDHVTKPIDPDQLFATLQKWIKRAAVPKSSPASGGPQAIDAIPEPDQAVPAEDELPESLPGFDLAAGLSRLMGNKRLYRKLLLDFGANYGGVADEIRRTLEAKDFKQAHSLAHNLKGLSGNLEATDLHVAAVDMETLVKGRTAETTPDKELNRKFAELENALDQALDAVQCLGSTAEKKTIASSKDVKVSVSPEQLKKVTESIKDATEMGDVTQIKSIAAKLLAESDALAPFCDELIQLADDFDFDGIQKLVHELDG